MTKWHLVNFEGFFYKHQVIRPLSIEHGKDSLKFAPFSPLITHISHDSSGSKQVDPLKTLYKRDLTPLAQGTFYYLSTHYPCVLEKKTDLTVRGSLAGSPRHLWQLFSFSFGHQIVVVSLSIQPTDFSTSLVGTVYGKVTKVLKC